VSNHLEILLTVQTVDHYSTSPSTFIDLLGVVYVYFISWIIDLMEVLDHVSCKHHYLLSNYESTEPAHKLLLFETKFRLISRLQKYTWCTMLGLLAYAYADDKPKTKGFCCPVTPYLQLITG